jgi:hypothetical protein
MRERIALRYGECAGPACRLFDGQPHDRPRQVVDQSALFGQRNEMIGLDQSLARMIPAHECLEGDHLARRKLYQRLVVQHQLAGVDRGSQFFRPVRGRRRGMLLERAAERFQANRFGKNAAHVQSEIGTEIADRPQHLVVDPAHEHDRRAEAFRGHRAQQLDAVDFRHLQIHQDERRLPFARLLEEEVRVARRDDVVSGVFSDVSNDGQQSLLIIDGEKASVGHG